MKFDEMSETSISHCSHTLVGSAPHLGAVVRVAADHDGVVPGHPGEDTMVTDVVLDVMRCPQGSRGAVGHCRWRAWRGDRSSI